METTMIVSYFFATLMFLVPLLGVLYSKGLTDEFWIYASVSAISVSIPWLNCIVALFSMVYYFGKLDREE